MKHPQIIRACTKLAMTIFLLGGLQLQANARSQTFDARDWFASQELLLFGFEKSERENTPTQRLYTAALENYRILDRAIAESRMESEKVQLLAMGLRSYLPLQRFDFSSDILEVFASYQKNQIRLFEKAMSEISSSQKQELLQELQELAESEAGQD